MDRREFIVKSLIFSSALSMPLLAGVNDKVLRIGVVTDCHSADKITGANNTRQYRDAVKKMTQAVDQFNQDEMDFVIELGDLIDSANSVETEISYLKTIEKAYSKAKAPRHYVYGNHCLDTLTRKEFSAHTDANEKGYYSFDQGLYHIVILDACYTSKGVPYSRKNFHWTDANIPKEELLWLKADLEKTNRPTIVFVHQRLDGGKHSVKNAALTRKVLEKSKRVIAVFQGHAHINTHLEINKIHYTTMRSMVDGKGLSNSGYSEILLDKTGTITIKGFEKQSSYKWPKSSR